MSNQTDDNSSESESEFFVSPNEIDLDSNFFHNKGKKTNVTLRKAGNCENSDDSDEFSNVNDNNSVEIFSQVLKNLENTQAICTQSEQNSDKNETTIDSSTKQKKTKVICSEDEKNHLSQHVNELLFEGEGKTFELDGNEDNSEDEKLNDAAGSDNYTTPKEGVKITLPGTAVIFNKKRNGPDLNTIIENRINQRLRANQVLIHKVGILCWFAHGFHVNKVINDTEIMSASLSLIPTENLPKKRSDLKYIEKFVTWFKKKFVFKEKEEKEECITKDMLLKRLKEKEVFNYKELVFLCIAMLRAIGLNCRLIISFHPPPLKLQRSQLFTSKPKEKKDTDNKNSDKPIKKEKTIKTEKNTKTKRGKKTEKNTSPEKKIIPENSETARKNAQLEAKKRAAEILSERTTRSKSIKNKTSTSTSNETTNNKSNVEQTKKSNTKQNETEKSENSDKTISNTISRQLRSRKQIKLSNEDNPVDSKSTKKEKVTTTRSTRSKQKSKVVEEDSFEEMDESSSEEYDSEKEFAPPKKRSISKPKNNVRKSSIKKENKLLSSDDEANDDINNTKNNKNFWLEVYVESEENWISVNIMDEKVHCVNELYKAASKPVLYVIAWNMDGTLRDVTRRYCPHWLTVTRKQRIDENWFKDTLHPWKEKKSAISEAEDKLLEQKELEQPLPKTIGECKNHPHYVLIRHLLKYEALYPSDCVPLGYLPNGEAIYSRHCVYVLSSRETWLRKARVVKPNQEAYKVVKALPKYDKLSGAKLADRMLELFGEWQTTEYVPPEAKDGIVPRNEYGNVDLFQKSMLPKGTVYIDLPGLNRIARKLNIDCAPAVIGFKFGTMGALPAFEGFVVCTEYEDTLREAWESEQIEAKKRAREKRFKRIYGNWKRLIDGMRIKEKLAEKYEFHKEKTTTTNSTKRTKQKTTDAKRQKTT
ncbi:PREDICTED: DNA repair protein complementing XP-C cells homolog [Polistes dominula]|uniref:DNA repair protein complementing XP-C cells homolog n=1 Tax=Polistes dominula TaxID=743375 RepID=A0ABM1I5D0_POLDO|nr:PREDICTED: DNA repair protein complementing XP-C cells homolog [Polistes dominula]